MEDENGLELSLGLSCGGSSSKSKVKDAIAETPPGEGYRSRTVFDPSQKPFGPPQAQVTDVFKAHLQANKRKSPIEETNPQKKIEIASSYRGHVSLREDISPAELDEVAESEAEGSSTRVDQEQPAGGDLRKSTHEKVPLTFQGLAARNNGFGFASKCGMQLTPMTSAVIHQAFGYSAVQLPCLETSSSWIFSGHTANLEHKENGIKTSSAQRVDGKALEVAKVGSSSSNMGKQVEDMAGTSISAHIETRPNNGPDPFSLEVSSIKPGIAANLMFGGSGSRPDLPWVSTTGPGPNGKTISGVTYKFSPNQVKIVCACHGSHMTPEEFIQHASQKQGDANNNLAAQN